MTTTSSASSTFAGFAEVSDEIRTLRGKLDKVRRLSGFISGLPDEDLPLAVGLFAGSRLVLQVGFAVLEAAGRAVTGASEAAFAKYRSTQDGAKTG